jgi:AcrR family transcriptional regulator
MFELVGEGDLRPSAQRVADRAGVGIRTVFRHFDEMDRLYAEMNARLRSMIRPLLAEGTPVGTLPRRARELVAKRCELYERVGPYKRAANLHRQSSDYLQKRHRSMVRDLRVDLERWLPELGAAPGPLVHALEAAVSFEAWDRLRSDQKLGQKDTREAMQTTVDALIGAMPRARA